MALGEREYYMGNTKLKRVNVPVNYTPEQTREFMKCATDPIYFIANYIKIVHVDHGLINFDLWDFQRRMINTITNNRFSIIKLSRQCGKTQTVAALIIWYILFHENFAAGILAHKITQARDILARIRMSYEEVPKWLQQGIREWNKESIEIENGSKVFVDSTSQGAARGKTFNLILLDEFAHVEQHIATNFYTSVYPTISSGNTTKLIIISTPKGLNMFYKLWREAEEGKNSYAAFSAHWSEVPGRDQKWKEETIKNTSLDQFRQEFETEFIGSSNTLIHPEKLLALVARTPIKITDDYAIYENPTDPENLKKLYLIIVDTSHGTGDDYSAFVVYDVTQIPYRIAARYTCNTISPLIFPSVIHHFARQYHDAFVCIEINDNGSQVANILYHELEYENLMMTQTRGRAGQVISTGFASRPSFGVRMSKQVKRIGCANLKTLIENDKLIVDDLELIEQLYRFVETNQTYAAEEGAHDDIVMCCVIFAWLATQPYFKEWSDTNVRERLYNEQKNAIEEDILPVMHHDDGRFAYIEAESQHRIVEVSDRFFWRWLNE